MRRGLRVAAGGIVVLALAGWVLAGANRGWTKTSVTRMEKEPVTELPFPVTEKKFVPGLDALGAAFFVAALLVVGSCFVPQKNTHESHS